MTSIQSSISHRESGQIVFPLLWTQIRVNGTTGIPVAYCDYNMQWGMGIGVFALVAAAQIEQGQQRSIRAIAWVKALLAKEYLDLVRQKTAGRKQRF